MASAPTLVRAVSVGSFTLREVLYAPGAVLGRHAHANARFAAVLAGRYREEYGGRRFECSPGSVTYRPAGAVHANRFLEQTRCLMVECDGVDGIDQPVQHEDTFDVAMQIHREMVRPDAASPLILEGLLMRLASRVAADAPPWLVAVRERIVADDGARMTLRELASSSGVQPSHLATSFRRAFGCTVGEFKRRRRVAVAIDLLAREMTLADVALACGFSDQSHFTREFRRASGMTPAAFRRAQSRTKI